MYVNGILSINVGSSIVIDVADFAAHGFSWTQLANLIPLVPNGVGKALPYIKVGKTQLEATEQVLDALKRIGNLDLSTQQSLIKSLDNISDPDVALKTLTSKLDDLLKRGDVPLDKNFQLLREAQTAGEKIEWGTSAARRRLYR
jgi:hypothetical protein